MEKFLKTIAVIAIGLTSIAVNAFAFQVFWNEVILNIWQLYETVDVVNTMSLPYGAFVALTLGLVLVRNGNTTESDKDEMEIIKIAIGKILTKLIYIFLTLLAVTIVF